MSTQPATPTATMRTSAATTGELVHRQSWLTRLTHATWAIAMFFLLLSGLQIFNAHPALYLGDQSGFAFDNSVLSMTAQNTPAGPTGYTTVFGHRFDTTGLLGLSRDGGGPSARGFPPWATIPSYQDLATGRVVHFFFAWVLVFTLAIWLVGSLVNGHLVRDLVPRLRDIRNLPRDIVTHARFRFHRTRSYGPLQKLSYAGVLLVVLPLIILTGLSMSPTMNAAMPFLPEMFGGRQTARALHFLAMLVLVGFFAVHILMVLAAGPLNEIRSIVTGWYRIDPPAGPSEKDEA